MPEEVIARFKLDTAFYKKHLDYHGFSILSSAKVSDAALLEARYLIDKLLGERQDILKAMIENGCRFMVMEVPSEMTTDVPEQRSWDKEYWAEGVQAYFDCMRPQFGANTREKLEKYDAGLFGLVDEVYKQSKFRYVRYDRRAVWYNDVTRELPIRPYGRVSRRTNCECPWRRYDSWPVS